MYKNRKVLGIITARGGSKSIPKKNIVNVAGKPLIAYTILAAQKSGLLTDFLVSTDDPEIAEVARSCGARVPFLRPTELASDGAKSIPVLIHALDWVKENEGKIYDYAMILQPTSPLRNFEDIDNCIKKIVDTEADSVMSMVEVVDFSIAKMKRIDDGLILPAFEEEGKESMSRQLEGKIYKRNCAIYLTKTDLIYKNDLFGSTSRAYVMPQESSVDINVPDDLKLAEYFLLKRNYNEI